MVDEIFRLAMSKKFRKYSVSPEYAEHIRSAIQFNIEKDEPIKFTLVFGGYKLWRLKEAPEVDWAELFSLIYYANWVKPIAEIYKPGIWFDFYSDDVILEFMNNVPKTDTEAYGKSFRALLEFFNVYLPPNIKFTLNRVRDQYPSYEAFKTNLDQEINKLKEELKNNIPELTTEQVKMIEQNVKLNPGQGEDLQWREKVQLIHDGYTCVSGRRPYYRTPDKIMVITRPIDNSIAVGTTKTSVVKFWIGVGALKKRGDSFIETVLSPEQIEAVSSEVEPIKISGLEDENFNNIRIVV